MHVNGSVFRNYCDVCSPLSHPAISVVSLFLLITVAIDRILIVVATTSLHEPSTATDDVPTQNQELSATVTMMTEIAFCREVLPADAANELPDRESIFVYHTHLIWSLGVSVLFKQSKHASNIDSNGYQKRLKTTKTLGKKHAF